VKISTTLIAIMLIVCLTAFLMPPNPYAPEIVHADSVNLAPQADSYVRQDYSGSNYGTSTALCTDPRTSYVRRTWIRFDLSSIPAGAIITSAKLKLYYYGYGGTNPSGRTIECHHCTDDSWTESGIKWTNAPNSQCAGSATDLETVPASYGWMEWVVTSDVQSDFSGDKKVSWRLKDSAEGGSTNRRVNWASKEHTTAAWRPVLEVTYVLEGFSISLDPTDVSMPNKVSSETTVDVIVTPTGGWTGDVTLSVSGLPAGVSYSFTTNPVTLSGSDVETTLTLHVDSETTADTYTVTVSGSGDGKTASATLTLTIGPIQYYPFDVKVGASKIIVTCTWSGSGTIEITLIEPDGTQHLESGLVTYERTTVAVVSGAAVYYHLKRVELSSPASGAWTLKLTISGVTTYQADIEII